MEKIKIITDSSCDLSKDIIEKYDIEVLPLLINFGEESYLDGTEIKLPEMLERIEREDCLPTTAQVTPTRFLKSYKQWIEQGYKLIVIPLSSKMSGTYQSASIAKMDMENDDIVVIDSEQVTTGLGLIVLKAARMIKEGRNLEEIVNEINKYKNNVNSAIAFESLDNLVRGGRLSKGKAMIVGALGIKLLLNIENGEMNVLGKVRGTKKIIKEIIEKFNSVPRKQGEPVILLEILNEEIRTALVQYLEENDIEYLHQQVGCAVGIHSGPKACGLFYVEDYK